MANNNNGLSVSYRSFLSIHPWILRPTISSQRWSKIGSDTQDLRIQLLGPPVTARRKCFWHCVFKTKPGPLWPHAMSNLSSCSQCLLFIFRLAYEWPLSCLRLSRPEKSAASGHRRLRISSIFLLLPEREQFSPRARPSHCVPCRFFDKFNFAKQRYGGSRLELRRVASAIPVPGFSAFRRRRK